VARPLPRTFFARDSDVVARDLLGRLLIHDSPRGRLSARITETEAYFGPAACNQHLASRRDISPGLRARLLEAGDPASHAFRGVTERNRLMFGPPGYWYVYFVYGMHECSNVVTGPKGGSGGFTPQSSSVESEPQAVLLRAAAPVEGADLMPRVDLGGPARLCQGLGITRADNGRDATRPPLWFEAGKRVLDRDVQVTPRIGVKLGADLPLRFFVEPDDRTG